MRRESKKRAAIRREWGPIRQVYLTVHSICMACDSSFSDEVHEIARGQGVREKAYQKIETWLALCRRCHAEMDDYSIWPLARQMAVKILRDPENFDLQEVNQVRGRAQDAIALSDVMKYLELKPAGG